MGALLDYRFPGDLPIFTALNDLPAPLARVICWTSYLPFGLICLAIALALLIRREGRPWGGLAVIAAIAATDLFGARMLKHLAHRLRPSDVLPAGSYHPWLQASRGASMPSLHSADAFAAATVIAGLLPRGGPYAYAAAAIIALSRIVGGVHWPSDVIAGAIYGTLVGWGALRVRLWAGGKGPRKREE